MPIDDRKYKRLTPENVARAPRKAGVYALYAHDTLVFLGSAAGDGETIRSALSNHVGEGAGRATQGATRYKREASDEAEARLKSLLAEFRASHGALPSGNARS